MRRPEIFNKFILICIVTALLIISALLAGCTGNTEHSTMTATTPVSVTVQDTAAPAAVTPTRTPNPAYTYTEGNVIAFTAASLTSVTPKLKESFEAIYPNHKVMFNLAGTQAIKTQIQNGAYADVFISASPKYTTELTDSGYFDDGTVETLTTNYVIVIIPADNPANIQSLNDLAKPGVKIARAAKTVPIGIATDGALAKLASSTYSQEWNNSVYENTVTFETSEPAVATKVSLGEVDAGFVYESTATAADAGTYTTITIPKTDNYLQTYSIAILKESTSKGAAADFENFMLSDAGQQILTDFGFRSP